MYFYNEILQENNQIEIFYRNILRKFLKKGLFRTKIVENDEKLVKNLKILQAFWKEITFFTKMHIDSGKEGRTTFGHKQTQLKDH